VDGKEYWEWFDEQLKQPSRALGGEPCIICENPIPKNAHWKFRDRHVCSTECNNKLKRRWKSKVRRGTAEGYQPSEALLKKVETTLKRKSRLMRTNLNATFPYEYDYFPIEGDILERHGHHTKYVPISELPCRAAFWEEITSTFGCSADQLLGALHLETGAWRVVILDIYKTPRNTSTGFFYLNNRCYNEFVPHTVVDKTGNEINLYCNHETFRCIGPDDKRYSWEAISFGTVAIESPLWTPEYQARSSKKSTRQEHGFPLQSERNKNRPQQE